MRNTPRRGLAGKARSTHFKSRASRMHAQQAIAESQDPKMRHAESRQIPIGHKREFIPSAAVGDADGVSAQLELPLSPSEPATGAVIRIPPRRVSAATDVDVQSEPASTKPKAAKRYWPFASGKGPQETGARSGFSVRGFLCGCAMGGAVAAMILLFAQTIIN